MAPLAGAYNLCGISYRGWLIEILSEGVFDEGSGRRVVPASPRLDFAQQFLALVDGDASFEDSRGAASVQLLLLPNNTNVLSHRALALPGGSSPQRRYSRYRVCQSEAGVASFHSSSICMASGLSARCVLVSGASSDASLITTDGLWTSLDKTFEGTVIFPKISLPIRQ